MNNEPLLPVCHFFDNSYFENFVKFEFLIPTRYGKASYKY